MIDRSGRFGAHRGQSTLLGGALLGLFAALCLGGCGDRIPGAGVSTGGQGTSFDRAEAGFSGAGDASGLSASPLCEATCSPNQVCVQGRCQTEAASCPAGAALCSGVCVDLAVTEAHCGACSRACSPTEICTLGVCACPPPMARCQDGCTDLSGDPQHCGGCDRRCAESMLCQEGRCVCPPDFLDCGGSCVDPRRNPEHCGQCGVACATGQACSSGQCVCPESQSLCGDACVETQKDSKNCGSCGKACGVGEFCETGSCVGGALLEQDQCAGLANGLTITELAVYQSVKIPIMAGGKEIAAASRNADLVTARDALFRIFVNLDASSTLRALAARVFVQSAEKTEVFHAKASLRGNSQEAELATTLQVVVPRGKLTRESRYAVEVVDCGPRSTGAIRAPRYPAHDAIRLGARETGPLKVHFIPLRANGLEPATDEKSLQVYRDALLALFPIGEVQASVGAVLSVSDSSDWLGNLDRLRERRQLDRAAADVYYYGLLKPAASYAAFCARGCVAGNAYMIPNAGNNLASLRVGMGLAFADDLTAFAAAHEIAHNHGREHAPCGRNLSGVDGDYPYSGGAVGVYGYDVRKRSLTKPAQTDLMGYCDNKWISDYTYQGLIDRVAAVNAQSLEYLPASLVQRWNVLLLDGDGPRWGASFAEPGAPAGEPEPAEILDQQGQVIGIETVYRTSVSHLDGGSFEVPARRPGWHSIRLIGAPPLAY